MAASDFLPIVGNVIDGLFGNYQRRKAPELAGKTAYAENMQGLLGRVEGAKSAGLHPLAALGANISGSGAPMPVGSDFGAGFESASRAIQGRKQFNADLQQRKIEEARREREEIDQRLLNEANRRRLNSESNLLDQQLINAQDELSRRQNMHTGSGIVTTGRGFGSKSANDSGGLVLEVPHEVTRDNPESPGTTAGRMPWRDIIEDGGYGYGQPHGMQSEGAEIFNTLREYSAMTGIPMTKLIGTPHMHRTAYEIMKPENVVKKFWTIRRLWRNRKLPRAFEE